MGIVGALAGWKRRKTDHGIVLTMQVAPSVDAARAHDFQLVHMALNDRQLRSLARDLSRAAHERGIELRPAKRHWWSAVASR